MEAALLEDAGVRRAKAARRKRSDASAGVDRYTEELRDVRGSSRVEIAVLRDRALRPARRASLPAFTAISSHSASPSARTRRSSASSTRCSCSRCHFRTARTSCCSTDRTPTSRWRDSASPRRLSRLAQANAPASPTSRRTHRLVDHLRRRGRAWRLSGLSVTRRFLRRVDARAAVWPPLSRADPASDTDNEIISRTVSGSGSSAAIRQSSAARSSSAAPRRGDRCPAKELRSRRPAARRNRRA